MRGLNGLVMIPFRLPGEYGSNGTRPREPSHWLAVPEHVDRPIGQRITMPIGAVIVTPAMLAVDAVSIPLDAAIGAPYLFGFLKAMLIR